MSQFRCLAAFACALTLATPALAQAPTATPPVIAPHACTKPEFPGKVAVDAKIKRWINEFKAYTECLKAYIGERNAAIDANAKSAKAAVDEFNSSVTEFNATMKTLQE